MGLFENDREANRASCIAMIEQVLDELGHGGHQARVVDAAVPTWAFVHGSAAVTVTLVDREDYTHLRVVAPVMTIDARVDVLKLYRHLLMLHAGEVHGAAFAACQHEIRLIAERSTIDLDRSEVLDMIQRVRDYTDEYDDRLVRAFGGRRGTL